MPVRNLNLALARLLVAGAVLSAALAALPAAAALPKPIAPPAPGGTSRASSLNDLPDSANPIAYQSAEGQFSTTFPTGCARLRTRMNMGEDGQATGQENAGSAPLADSLAEEARGHVEAISAG